MSSAVLSYDYDERDFIMTENLAVFDFGMDELEEIGANGEKTLIEWDDNQKGEFFPDASTLTHTEAAPWQQHLEEVARSDQTERELRIVLLGLTGMEALSPSSAITPPP